MVAGTAGTICVGALRDKRAGALPDLANRHYRLVDHRPGHGRHVDHRLVRHGALARESAVEQATRQLLRKDDLKRGDASSTTP